MRSPTIRASAAIWWPTSFFRDFGYGAYPGVLQHVAQGLSGAPTATRSRKIDRAAAASVAVGAAETRMATYFGWSSPWTYAFSCSVAASGAVWAWLYERSGSLSGPWLSHLVVDAALFPV